MEKYPHNRAERTACEHIAAGMTLIEMVVSITVIGVIGLGAAFFLVQLGETYVAGRSETLAVSRFSVALDQIAREVSSCLPAGLTVNDSPTSIQFHRIVAAGSATAVSNGQLVDRGNPGFSSIQAGMALVFRPYDTEPVVLQIDSVNQEERIIQANGITDRLPPQYWIVSRRIRYYLEGNRIIRRVGQDGPAAILCSGVSLFAASLGPDGTLRMRIRGSVEGLSESVTVEKGVLL